MKPNDRVYFKYGRHNCVGTIISIDFATASATIKVEKPEKGTAPEVVVFLTDLLATQKFIDEAEKALESGPITETCLCAPNNCKHIL